MGALAGAAAGMAARAAGKAALVALADAAARRTERKEMARGGPAPASPPKRAEQVGPDGTPGPFGV